METRAATTRLAILERAVNIASAEGLEGLTIGRLAGELAMSKSGLFAHFGSKEDLQLATVEFAAQRFFDEVVAPAQQAPEGYERLAAYCELYLGYLAHGVFKGGCFWAAAGAEFDDRPGAVREKVREGVGAWLGELERQASLADVEDPAGMAFEIYSLTMGANACSRLLEDDRAVALARGAIERRLSAVKA